MVWISFDCFRFETKLSNQSMESQLNSIHVDQPDASASAEFNLMMFNALPPTSSVVGSADAATGDHRYQSKRGPKPNALPRISPGIFSETPSTSPSSSSPPLLPQRQPPQLSQPSPNHQNMEWVPHQRNGGLVLTGRRHRPVVRTQSSRVSLLRQPPHSASSLVSEIGNEMETHFPMPDK